jgi:hypothetical protein
MSAPQPIKVIFRRLLFLNKAYLVGSGQFFFKAAVDGAKVGDRGSIFDASNKTWIDLPEDPWSQVLDVAGKKQVKFTFEGKDEDTAGNKKLGSVTYTLKAPYIQQKRRSKSKYFALEWSVELQVDGAFGEHPPDAVFACRENNGSLGCTTVSGKALTERLEFCPVRPVPDAKCLPKRPAVLTGEPVDHNDAGLNVINPTDPINVIPNPAVIPILQVSDANANSAARIEFTYYSAKIHKFQDDDSRLKWTSVAVSGGAVKFFGPACGRKILVYGTAAGEVRLECRFQGNLMGEYRALVGALKQIPCRFNILKGPLSWWQPRATPENVRDHLAIANRFLRQIALELTLDTNTSTSDGAQPTNIPGIFTILCLPGTTSGVATTGFMKATKFNYRPNVMNFAYILSDKDGNLGAADAYPASGAGVSIPDSGHPSSSWIPPSGVKPDPDASPIAMTVLAARLRPGFPKLASMYLTDTGNGDPANIKHMQTYANTMTHEFGHILNLGHRVEGVPETSPGAGDQRDMTAADPRASLNAKGIFWDGLVHPPGENVMHWCNPATQAQDFDIVQAKAARQSPLIPP